jgi:ferrous iron transport protein B
MCILADDSQFNRSLFVLTDYTRIYVPVVLLLNMIDVAKRQGKKVNTAGLEKARRIPVIPMVAADKSNIRLFAKRKDIQYSEFG